MMAHQLPQSLLQKKTAHMTQHPQKNSSGSKTNKHKPAKSGDRKLPNGESVDFGNTATNNTNSNNSNTTTTNNSQRKKKSANKSSSNATTSKAKTAANKLPQPVLPDGSKPNFYNNNPQTNSLSSSSSTAGSQFGKQSLPSGNKPVFDTRSHKGPNSFPNANASGKKSPSLPNGGKPDFGNTSESTISKPSKKSNKSAKDSKKQAVAEETYAGSSFHSSPAALNLPKPSFKTSPKANSAVKPATISGSVSSASSGSNSAGSSSGNSPTQHTHHQSLANGVGSNPAANATTPANIQYPATLAPPQYPVTMYPPGPFPGQGLAPNQLQPQQQAFPQPGFSYQVTPQGYINYHYPSGAAPPPAPMGASVPPHLGFPMMPSHSYPGSFPAGPHNQQAQLPGQKITFNELLGSSKV